MADTGRKPGSVSGRPKTSPDAIKIRQRQAQALQLRLSGATFHSIAEALGFNSDQAAYAAVKSALQATIQEPADELRQVDLGRIERMLLGVWPQAIQGHHGAIDRVLRLLERRARLLGLDAPERRELSGPDAGPIVFADADATLQKLSKLAGDAE